LSQRVFIELKEQGHVVSVQFDINDEITGASVKEFKPDMIICPFLKRRIAKSIWSNTVCLILHPGIPGDRGPSALDWAILNREQRWGVTCLQANDELDGGDIWSYRLFDFPKEKKSTIYRNQVTHAAVEAIIDAVNQYKAQTAEPFQLDYSLPHVKGKARIAITQMDRKIDWEMDSADTVLMKIQSADGFPGLRDEIYGKEFYLFGAHLEGALKGKVPGEVIAKRHGAICRATEDGAIWISHLKNLNARADSQIKLPATQVLSGYLNDVPECHLDVWSSASLPTFQDIRYWEKGNLGYMAFDFYNGAMSVNACKRLLDAYQYACKRNTRAIILLGGNDFWSNGIDLNQIEAAPSPADESWRNINAINDFVQAVINTTDKIIISALRGNAAAGGFFTALASDYIYAKDSIIINPHYKSMGNLYGSEYWTYLLPKKIGLSKSQWLVNQRLPLGTAQSKRLGLVDEVFGCSQFMVEVEKRAEGFSCDSRWFNLVEEKKQIRERDERTKSLAAYREEELEKMHLNFYGFDSSYHFSRYHFVLKTPKSRTPRYIAIH